MELADQSYSADKLEKFTSQLSAHIWGHRFKDGQRGPEYVLEFLNVLRGTGYSFDADHYSRNRSIGLRKFIFEGIKEGSSRDILVLDESEKQKLVQAVQENDIPVLKSFLRNLEVVLYNTTGKEADRSWFARSLYPLHESLLYVELRKVKNKGQKASLSFERNFYARGGELYYLMLAIGTEGIPERRHLIQSRLHELLNRNKVIEKVVNKIADAFGDEENGRDTSCRLRKLPEDAAEVPTLPKTAETENLGLFQDFAKELEQLLHLDIDIYEMFHLLTSLICFQLARYMHKRSYMNQTAHYYFFDCLEGSNKHIMQLSSTLFDEHENLIKERFEAEFESLFSTAVGNDQQIEEQLPRWKQDPEMLIGELGLGKMHGNRKEVIRKKINQCKNANDIRTHLYMAVRDAVSDQLKRHQLNITRVLSRDGGFATYRRGSAANYRYTISDSFLQMLVFTVVRPGSEMEYHDFLETIYRDYHIVIGERQAKQSGLYDRSKLNARYFQDNEKELRSKLKQNGLLVEFSDATAMIHNPYASSVEAVYA